MYAVIFTYNFDDDCTVTLFNDADKAKAYLKKSFETERKIEEEENDWDIETEHNDDWTYAKITHFGNFGADICEYHFSHDVEIAK